MTQGQGPGVLYLAVCAAPPARAVGELVQLLQRQGWTICVVATPLAAGWVDAAALTTQTGYQVRSEYQRPDDDDALPPADAIAVVPATFNTINKWVAGISDTLVLGILNEAIGLNLPILVEPYVKPSLAAHPAFGKSLETLSSWGVTIMENEAIRPPAGDGSVFKWQPVVDAIVAKSGQTWSATRPNR